MQIESTTNTTAYVNTTQTEKVQQSTTENKTVNTTFDIVTLENKSPIEITYSEYKKLDKEDIEQLFPKESMLKENEKAMALYTKVNLSDDEILNQVLFEKELEAKDSEVAKNTLGMIESFALNWEVMNTYYEVVDYSSEYKNIDKNYEPPIKGKFFDSDQMTAKNLFEIFNNNKLGYEANIEFYNYSPDSEEYQSYQEQIAYRESIKIAYEQKQNEQNATLDAYTRNTKQNLVSV